MLDSFLTEINPSNKKQIENFCEKYEGIISNLIYWPEKKIILKNNFLKVFFSGEKIALCTFPDYGARIVCIKTFPEFKFLFKKMVKYGSTNHATPF